MIVYIKMVIFIDIKLVLVEVELMEGKKDLKYMFIIEIVIKDVEFSLKNFNLYLYIIWRN